MQWRIYLLLRNRGLEFHLPWWQLTFQPFYPLVAGRFPEPLPTADNFISVPLKGLFIVLSWWVERSSHPSLVLSLFSFVYELSESEGWIEFLVCEKLRGLSKVSCSAFSLCLWTQLKEFFVSEVLGDSKLVHQTTFTFKNSFLF